MYLEWGGDRDIKLDFRLESTPTMHNDHICGCYMYLPGSSGSSSWRVTIGSGSFLAATERVMKAEYDMLWEGERERERERERESNTPLTE